MARVLIIDDDKAFRGVLAETLRDLGHTPIEAQNGEAGLERLAEAPADAVFLDFKMPGPDGLDILRRLRARPEAISLPVVMLTAFASSSNTIEAMKLGAFEHLTKPLRRRDIEMLMERMLSPAAATPPHTVISPQDRLVGQSEGMREVQKLIGRAAASDATVLIAGETGTGKELVASTLHESSARSAGPFVAVNCAAIPRDLLESELFGHLKGAFTGAIGNRIGAFQQADRGTLFLDEIGDMSTEMQSKLLRAIEERIVTPVGGNRAEPLDLRFVAATHHDLLGLVGEGKFREDLYYRLNVIPIHLPPLRERAADIQRLAEYFLARAGSADPKSLSDDAIKRLLDHPWPGNVRELRNAMERVATLVRGPIVEGRDLAFLSDAPSGAAAPAFDMTLLDGDLNVATESLERTMIHRALDASAGNRTEAARRLGIHRQLLYKKLKQFGFE
jgi:two-component system NtrC family response regulator